MQVFSLSVGASKRSTFRLPEKTLLGAFWRAPRHPLGNTPHVSSLLSAVTHSEKNNDILGFHHMVKEQLWHILYLGLSARFPKGKIGCVDCEIPSTTRGSSHPTVFQNHSLICLKVILGLKGAAFRIKNSG